MTEQKIGRFRTQRTLGMGGMGVVYEAYEESSGRRVALKVLHQNFASQPEIVHRMANEARAVQALRHPGVVQITECVREPIAV